MIFRRPRRSPGYDAALVLYESALRQARTPALYAEMGVPDTVEGRFELLTLHVILLIECVREQGRSALGQVIFDRYLRDLDGALREMGVGDLSVARRMRDLGRAFYGRAAAYRQALGGDADKGALEGLIARTLLAETSSQPSLLAQYARRCHAHLAAIDPATLADASHIWPPA